MVAEIATEVGDNWSVFFFVSPVDKLKRLLGELFQYIDNFEEAKIPHFMCREFCVAQNVGLSLRVLRSRDDASFVDSRLAAFSEEKEVQHEKEPQGNRHAWLRKGETDENWDAKRCEALHRLSMFVVFLAENDLFDSDSRCHNAHYLINMLSLQEATVPNSNQVSLWDVTNGNAATFQTQELPSQDNRICRKNLDL